MFGSRSGNTSGFPRLAASAASIALAALLAACGGAHHPAPPQAPTPPAELGPLYDFSELGLPGIVYGDVAPQGIANGGLVAGTSWDAIGNARAFFYNGKTNIDLGNFGGNGARAFAINRCGQVAGWGLTAAGTPHAFFYDGSLHDLGTLGGAESWGSAINTCGKVVGWALVGPSTDQPAAGQQHAFYHDGKTMRDLGTFGGTSSVANDVNSVGQAVGYAFGAGDAWYHAFLYDARTGAPILDIGPPGVNSVATGINEAGQVAGTTRDAEGLLRAFRYDAGAVHDLGLFTDSQGAEARAINASGHIVGHVYYADGGQVAFLHDGTALRKLGTLNGARFSDANAINAAGLAVGWSVDGPGGAQRATAWDMAYGLVDLNNRVKELPPGVALVSALAVADDGAIVVRTTAGLGLLRPRK